MPDSVTKIGSIGDATPDKVIEGNTFSSDEGLLREGTYDPDWAIKKSW